MRRVTVRSMHTVSRLNVLLMDRVRRAVMTWPLLRESVDLVLRRAETNTDCTNSDIRLKPSLAWDHDSIAHKPTGSKEGRTTLVKSSPQTIPEPAESKSSGFRDLET